jgi:AcrR family transcriptional regulator
MERTPAPRERLLAAAVAYALEHGIGDLSLRRLAAELGTSHRMLLYHFGSRDGLMVAVVDAVEAGERELMAQTLAHPEADLVETVRANFARLAEPSMWPQERLFFELYARALQGDPGARPLLDGVVDRWVDRMADVLVAQGHSEDEARADARLGVAVVRGLLLDLLATGDREAVAAAMERYLEGWAASATRRA